MEGRGAACGREDAEDGVDGAEGPEHLPEMIPGRGGSELTSGRGDLVSPIPFSAVGGVMMVS